MGFFMTIPGELRFEILVRLDIPSVCKMRGVNHYFQEMVDSNQERIFTAILENVECVAPHSSLLERHSRGDSGYYSFSDTQKIYGLKQRIHRLTEICHLTTQEKIGTLCCLHRLLWGGYLSLIACENLRDDELRKAIFSVFTTGELQQMLPLVISVLSKVAQIIQAKVRRGVGVYRLYRYCNTLLVLHGMDVMLLLDLWAKTGILEAEIEKLFDHRFFDNVLNRPPMIHDEIARELSERGIYSITDQDIINGQFFQECTYLDMADEPDEPEERDEDDEGDEGDEGYEE